jgi:hypothetical protein
VILIYIYVVHLGISQRRNVPVADTNELRTTAAKMCSECSNDALGKVRNTEIDSERRKTDENRCFCLEVLGSRISANAKHYPDDSILFLFSVSLIKFR